MNETQIAHWNGNAGDTWVALQDRLDANIAAISAAILAAANPQPGETVLDVGCGTGTTALALADAVGVDGRVTGLDVSKTMLALARRRCETHANIELIEADAAVHPFANQYDLLFSRFGVMFFDDAIGAFANLHRALKPGGRLAFVCWRAADENLWASAPLAAAKPFLPGLPPPEPNAPGPFALADPQRILSILSDVGFHDVETSPFDAPMPMGVDLDDVAAFTLRAGPLSRAASEADNAARTQILPAVRDALAPFRAANGQVAPPSACWLVSARTAG